jgi:hypothetical protein
MCELIIMLTNDERRRADLAAAALGKTVAEMVADELHARYGVLEQGSEVVLLQLKPQEGTDGHH